jgi:plastocyanin
MRKYILSIMLSFALVSLVSATTINVDVASYAFTPSSFDVAVGDTIIWTLSSGNHTTTSTSVPAGAATWDYTFSGIGDSFTYIVAVEGVYEYHCAFHPTLMIASFSTQVPLPMVENFDFPADDLLTMHGWTAHSGTGTQSITVNNGGLTFPGYPSSGIGNAALLDNNGEDIHRLFEPVSSGAVYMSFMVDVINNPAGYFIHYTPNPHNTFDFRGRVWIKGTAPNLEFGLSYASSDTIFTAPIYNLDSTYVCVVKYEVVAGDFNDIVSLFVFGSSDVLPTIEPTPTVGPITNATTSADIIPGSVSLRQYNASQNIIVDGIRIGTNWIDVVPVELTSFTASVNENSVTLNWKTATETNNSGFQVQRKTSNSEWTNVTFIKGTGTSTQAHNYSYTDQNLESGNYSYRLKQIDFDGSFDYSNIVNASVSAPAKFELTQNYPNPFNPTTKINFSVPANGNVRLTVYNVLGQEITTLVNGFMKAGSHTVQFNAANLNSGLYFYKLESNNLAQVKKMMLLK